MASYELHGAVAPAGLNGGNAPRTSFLRWVLTVSALLALDLGATVTISRAAGGLLADVAAAGEVGFEAILVVAAGAAAWLCLTWLTLGSILLALAALPAGAGDLCGRLAERTVPPLLRRAAGAMLGASVLGVPTFGALPASAAGYPDRPSATPAALVTASFERSLNASHPPDSWSDPEPLPGLDRPAASPPAHRRTDGSISARVVVRPGDSLWRLTARSLGPGAPDAAVAVGWRSWYATNRAVIGPDPDLILPGQVLSAPPGHRVARPHPPLEENP